MGRGGSFEGNKKNKFFEKKQISRNFLIFFNYHPQNQIQTRSVHKMTNH